MSLPTFVFDCGDTLLFLEPSREAMCAEVLRGLGHEVPAGRVERAYAQVDFALRMKSSELAHQEDKQGFYRALNRAVLTSLGLTSLFERFHPAMVAMVGEKRKWTVRPGATHTLRCLQERGAALFVLANWDTGLRGLLEARGLAGYFVDVCDSETLGAEKPDRAAFDAFFARTGVKAEDCVYVGNDYGADIAGSRGAGMQSVLIDVAGRYGPHVDCAYVTSWEAFDAHVDATWGPT